MCACARACARASACARLLDRKRRRERWAQSAPVAVQRVPNVHVANAEVRLRKGRVGWEVGGQERRGDVGDVKSRSENDRARAEREGWRAGIRELATELASERQGGGAEKEAGERGGRKSGAEEGAGERGGRESGGTGAKRERRERERRERERRERGGEGRATEAELLAEGRILRKTDLGIHGIRLGGETDRKVGWVDELPCIEEQQSALKRLPPQPDGMRREAKLRDRSFGLPEQLSI
eukprot:6184991-Pleurochrysis_carterae.AAC.1